MKSFAILLFVGIIVTAQASPILEGENGQFTNLTSTTTSGISGISSSTATPQQHLPVMSGGDLSVLVQKDKTSAPCPTLESLKGKDCTREYKPICSSNGQTFNNQCEFENAQKHDPTLTMTRTGTC